MRTAILSDIHANLIGLQACLDALERLRVDRIFCLGDIVGYNPWPNECIQIIRERLIPCVMGNHDRVAAGLEEPDNFNALATEAILWTRRILSQAHTDFLAKLPDRRALDRSAVLVHGSPRDPDEYILTSETARENIAFMSKRLGCSLCFFGHTHVPAIFDGAYTGVRVFEGIFHIDGRHAWLVNPGSIGQPRDGDPRSSFVIYDDNSMTVEFHRVEYDIQSVNDAIAGEGLPPHLGRRLFLGT